MKVRKLGKSKVELLAKPKKIKDFMGREHATQIGTFTECTGEDYSIKLGSWGDRTLSIGCFDYSELLEDAKEGYNLRESSCGYLIVYEEVYILDSSTAEEIYCMCILEELYQKDVQ